MQWRFHDDRSLLGHQPGPARLLHTFLAPESGRGRQCGQRREPPVRIDHTHRLPTQVPLQPPPPPPPPPHSRCSLPRLCRCRRRTVGSSSLSLSLCLCLIFPDVNDAGRIQPRRSLAFMFPTDGRSLTDRNYGQCQQSSMLLALLSKG